MKRLAWMVLLWAWLAPSMAATVVHESVIHRREIAIAQKLRCTVCQAESLAVSQAGIAADMRKLIRQKLRAGQTPAQIRAYFVKRYGDYILLKPPFTFRYSARLHGPRVGMMRPVHRCGTNAASHDPPVGARVRDVR